MKSFIDNDNDVILNTCNGISKTRTIKSSELIEIIEARIEEIFTLVNKDLVSRGIKNNINNKKECYYEQSKSVFYKKMQLLL